VVVQDLTESGDTLVARYTIIGTLREDFLGVPGEGQRIELSGISILTFRDGQCFERWTCSDNLILLGQIGVPIANSPHS
jgi:predicted ester cyclase